MAESEVPVPSSPETCSDSTVLTIFTFVKCLSYKMNTLYKILKSVQQVVKFVNLMHITVKQIWTHCISFLIVTLGFQTLFRMSFWNIIMTFLSGFPFHTIYVYVKYFISISRDIMLKFLILFSWFMLTDTRIYLSVIYCEKLMVSFDLNRLW